MSASDEEIAGKARDGVRKYFRKPYYPSEYGNDEVYQIIFAAIQSARTAPSEDTKRLDWLEKNRTIFQGDMRAAIDAARQSEKQ